MERPLGNLERYMLTQSLVSCDPAMSFAAKLPRANPLATSAVLAAISTLLIRHPLLSCTVPSPKTRTPGFKGRHVEPSEVLRGGEEVSLAQCSPTTIEDGLKIGIDAARSIDVQIGPLWQVALLEAREASSTEAGVGEGTMLVLGISHVISDGVGSKNLFEELLALAYHPADSATVAAAPTLESCVDTRPSVRQTFQIIFKEKISPQLPTFLAPTSLPSFPRPLAVPDAHKQPTALRLVSIPFDIVSAIKRSGKSHGINTLHPILHGCLLGALVLACPTDASPSAIKLFTPSSLRCEGIHPQATGNYIAGFESEDRDLTPKSPFWPICRSFAARLVDPAERAKAAGMTGRTRFIPDAEPNGWFPFLEAKRDKGLEKRISCVHSNVGVVHTPHGVEVAWAHNATAVGPAFVLSVGSTAGGPLAIALSWLDQTVADDVVEAFWTAFQALILSVEKDVVECVTIEGLLL